MRKAVVVIPCYNEVKRLSRDRIRELVEDGDIAVLLVDDGSSDGTAELLESIVAHLSPAVQCLLLPRNAGKAEAVRLGLRSAIDGGATWIGFADADFSTGPGELKRLVRELKREQADAVLGSRVARLGATIHRSPFRHYGGRLFATVAALTLRVQVYDTQCGAKWFLVNPRLERALKVPFRTRWAFDVELLGRLFGVFRSGSDDPFGRASEDRLANGPPRIVEVPLLEWRDVRGSKMRLSGMVRGFSEASLLLVHSLLSHGLQAGREGRDAPPGPADPGITPKTAAHVGSEPDAPASDTTDFTDYAKDAP